MKVCILLAEQVSLFEFACAVELFALPRPEIDNWYEAEVVSLDNTNFAGLCDTEIVCTQVQTLPDVDLLVVPSFPISIEQPNEHLIAELRRCYHSGTRIISFCSGSFLLAAAGLLEQRSATTHWRYAEAFKQRFPNIEYKDDVLYEYDGQIGCSAGSAAGIDLGIEVIRQDLGYQAANTVARRMVLPAHRTGGQTQFVEKPVKQTQTTLAKAMDWAVKNLSSELTIDQIAEQASMTRRTFDRHFKRDLNLTPLEWLHERKLEVAKGLLESSDLPLEQIAAHSGFDNAITLRFNFKKYLSISPSEYKTRFAQSQQTR